MPNQKGGKKFKRGKKPTLTKREFITKDPKEHEEYAVVRKILGSGRYELFCQDSISRIGICRGQIKKRTRFIIDDIVLVSLWVDLQDDKCSIIHKYEEDEIHKLKSMNEISPVLRKDESETIDDDIFDYSNPVSDDSKSEDEMDKHELKMPSSEDESEDELEQEINLDDI